MPVYLFNIHGYRTWMPDHPRGYTRKNEGVFPPDEDMARNYEQRSHFDEIRFDEARQRVVVDACVEVCGNIGVHVYHAVCVTTHLHALVGWRDDREWTVIYDRIKRIVALKLARSEGVSGRRWLAARRNGTAIEGWRHFHFHMTEYLPDHHGVRFVDEEMLARVYTRGPR